MNKQGFRYRILLMVILGALFLLAYVYIGNNFSKIFFSNSNDAPNLATFGRVKFQIDNLIRQKGDFIYSNNQIIALNSQYTIVGFNKEWDGSTLSDGCDPFDRVQKPAFCGDLACLCLFKDSDEDFEDMALVECQNFKGVDNFFTMAYWKNNDEFPLIPESIWRNQIGYIYEGGVPYPYLDGNNTMYSYFFLYGECDGWWNDEKLGSENFYFEKYVKDNKVNIFINFASDYNQIRIDNLK